MSLLGTQYQQDEPFPEFQCYYKDSDYPASCGVALPGANVHIFIKNDGASAVAMDDVILGAFSLDTVLKFNDLNDHSVNSIWFYWDNPPQAILDAGEPAWYRMDPPSIPAGGAGQVIVRLRRVPTTPSLALSVDTTANILSTNVTVDVNAPQVASITFSADLMKAYIYWRRAGGAAPASIKMDGVDATSITSTVGEAGDNFAISVISLSTPVTEMSYHVFQGIYADGATATGGIRVWLNPFVYGSWGAFSVDDGNTAMAQAWLNTCQDRGINTLEVTSASGGLMSYLGTSAGKAYADSRNYGFIKDDNLWGTWSNNPRLWFIDDEPDNEEGNLLKNFCGTGYKLPCSSNQAGTMGMHFISVAEDLRNIKNRPTTINIDGTWKPYSWYAYGQLSDCLAIDNYFQPHVRHAYYDMPETLPLYRKATAVYATSLAGTRAAEPNPFRQLLYSCEMNEDSPVDPWPWAAPECKRVEAYYAMAAGAKGISYWWFKENPSSSNGLGGDNLQAQDPALWQEIGLLGTEIKLLQPYLVTSHPVDLAVQGSTNVWVKALARGTDTFILFVVNDDYWLDQDYHNTPVANASVTVSLPGWMLTSATAFEVSRTGISNVSTSQNGSNLSVGLGTLNVAKILVVTVDPQLRMTLQQRYDQQVWPGICNFASSVCHQNTSAPSFVAHPASQGALAGGSATFTIVAAGGSQMSYQWQKNSVNLANGGHYAGCTTPFLLVSSINSNDVANYRCVVTSPYGSATSNQAGLSTITINITQHPAAQTLCAGLNAQFSVTAAGQGALSYRWQKDNVNLSNGGHYSGVTTNTLTVTGADANDAANYRCAVTEGVSTVYSNAAPLILKTATAITQHPLTQMVDLTMAANLTVAAVGDGALTYQWQKNQVNMGNGGHYSNCTTATLTVSSFDANDAAAYRCVVTGGCGSAISNEATLSINQCGSSLSLVNGAFDAITAGWNVAANWTSYSSGAGVFSKDTSTYRSSPNGQKMEPPATGAGSYSGVRQTISGGVGDAITFVGWAYQNSTNTYETARMGARFDGLTSPPSSWSAVSTRQVWTSLTRAGTLTVANGATVFLDVLHGSNGNYWSTFDDVSAYRAYVPEAPVVAPVSSTSLSVNMNPGCNTTNNAAEYAITVGGGAYTLGTHWVQANGTVGTTTLWQTDASWATKTVTGLATGTAYTFKVKARYNSTYTQETSLGAGAAGTPGGVCTPPAAPIVAQANPPAVCSGMSSQLSATPGSGGDLIEWFTAGCGTTVVPGGASPTVSPAATTTYYARTKQSSSGCTSSSCASVTLAVSVPSVASDFDNDCDVDLSDLSRMVNCVSGAKVVQTTPACQTADLDGDTDVDQSDFGIFQRCFGGENNPVAPNCSH